MCTSLERLAKYNNVMWKFCVELEIKARLKEQKEMLIKMIEPRYGLLDRLLSLRVLSDEELEEVREFKINVNKTVTKLLEILQSKQEVDQFESFLEALKTTKQSHVVNFLLQKDGGMQ